MEFGRVWYYRKHGGAASAKRAANLRKFLAYNEKFTGSRADLRNQRAAQKNLAAIGAGIGNNRAGSKRKKGSMKSQFRYKVGELGSAGQRPRPYLGVIKGNAALGAVREQVEKKLTDAVRKEWDRIGEYR